ncbi:tRNA-intron lyase [Halanaeroarchaeum sulfurireducens]|uniref:tRNA-splicing endonuclease n=1 Tax=Halanaeroarchaeum sulfurireducens TaxID=1604004 RepID=A0A0N9N7U9_9EURY|nr:tRNA-intron lyase [Halanaeroarchaeum sulfurireducens]ALG82934.1 tRNA-splicing endonuclease [Halanaeroarchaeum sulfurireducens]
MDAEVHGDEIRVGGDARQRFHDARGYGRPLEGNRIALAPVEAAHLLYRGDLETVEGMDFRSFITTRPAGFGARFLVYLDLRDRGFYLSPAREGWVDDPEGVDLIVYPRGKGPGDGEVAHRVRVVGERADVAARSLDDQVVAVVDEEGDLTYLAVSSVEPGGTTRIEWDEPVAGALLDDRVVVWDPPSILHDRAFYGKPLEGRAAAYEALHLSLVEGAYLAARGLLTLPDEGGVETLVEHGRSVEGDRFDRRLRAYSALRDRGAVPKTGFKFGADFRVYREVTSADDLGHSELLVRVVPADTRFAPRDLALDVRLAHGVRKRMVFALDAANEDTIRWRAVSRLTP